jgi:hypothetical protein
MHINLDINRKRTLANNFTKYVLHMNITSKLEINLS